MATECITVPVLSLWTVFRPLLKEGKWKGRTGCIVSDIGFIVTTEMIACAVLDRGYKFTNQHEAHCCASIARGIV